MIKDIHKIKQELQGFVEVDKHYDFKKGIPVKYITLKDQEEVFYQGGTFVSLGNNCLVLSSKTNQTWNVYLSYKNKHGEDYYITRIFIPETFEDSLSKNEQETKDIISYQQTIIQKASQKIKQLEIEKKQLLDYNQTMEKLLAQSRESLLKISTT